MGALEEETPPTLPPPVKTYAALLNAEQRFQAGVTATLVRDGTLRSVVVTGCPRTQALRVIGGYAEEGGWLVRSISTPDTIWRDMQGRREQRGTKHRQLGGTGEAPSRVIAPELSMLGKVGYAHLVEGRE